MAYISEEIGDAYKTWSAKKPVIIHAPTGAGKTYFILSKLLPYVAECGKKMVYLSNRNALKQQVENELRCNPMLTKYQNAIMICNYQEFSFVDLRNGGDRPYGLSDDQKKRWRKHHEIINADYYVLDEAHYFLADSDFNMKLEDCIRRIKEIQTRNSSAIWIYMTATVPYLLLYLSLNTAGTLNEPRPQKPPYLQTPHLHKYKCYFQSAKALLTYKEQQDVFCDYFDNEVEAWQRFKTGPQIPNPIIDMSRNINIATKRHFQKRYEQYDKFLEAIKTRLDYYCVKPQQSRYIPIYFSTDEELLSAINQSPEEDKWLIFISSKANGEKLQESLTSAGYTDTIFLKSTSKSKKDTTAEKKTWNQIVKEENFSQKILISTKVLDNGVNIKDTNLRHLVIQDLEQTTFLQMLGRKRFSNEDDTERVFVYLRNVPEGTLRKYFQKNIQNIMLFWYHLLKIQDRPNLQMDLLAEIQGFQSVYMESGHYKAPYKNYVVEKDMRYDKAGKCIPKDNPGLLVDLYQPDEFSLLKLTYRYYKLLSLLEKAQDERLPILSGGNYSTAEEYETLDESLQQQQFIWIKEQLSWLGIPTDGENWDADPLNPVNPDHWIGVYFHLVESAKEELLQFLDSHIGPLSKDEAAELKSLYHKFLVTHSPRDPAVKLKGSIKKIQEFLVNHGFPYRVYSKKCMREGKQRNWWHIERVDDSSQETSN